MKKRLVFRTSVAILAMVGSVAGVAVVTGALDNAAPVGDHWVDNLGSGTTASDFDGNSSSDCTSEAFTSGDYDLWHFIVNSASDEDTILSWNAANSVWESPSSVSVVDVSSQYGPYTSGDGTKHLWIATTPPGATLVSAYLNYDGTAGRENLSHACGRSAPTPSIKIDPIIKYDMTWDWQVDKTVKWSTNPAGSYVLDYEVVASRSAAPRIIPGSLHITDSVLVTPPSLVLSSLSVTFSQGTYSQPCTANLAALHYDCEIDITQITRDTTTGRPTGTGTLSAAATYSGGTLTDTLSVDLGTAEPTNVFGETGTLTDDHATPSDPSDDSSTTEAQIQYSVNWTPTGTTCNERTNTATVLIDDPAPGTENPTDSVTVRWCPPKPGLTIGYWGNKTGALFVLDHYAALKSLYPNALSFVPNLTTTTAVRNFFQNATCTGSCQSMFAAQFLGAALNALDTDFANQSISVNDTCKTVPQLLVEANAGALGATKTWYETYKSLFDAINNSRQVPCLTVID